MNVEGPIFITGSPRAGTSIFFLALSRATSLPGHNEGHFLGIYSLLSNMIARFYTVSATRAMNPKYTISHISEKEVERGIVLQLLGMCNKVHGARTWIDKSTGVPMLEFIEAMAEQNLPFKAFFMYRRALENVYSRLKKFPGHDLQYHARDWVSIMVKWREMRERLPAGSFLEIDQKDIADRPNDVGTRAARLLELSEEQQSVMVQILKTKKSQQLASESIGRVLSLESTGWSSEQRAQFMDIVGDELVQWQYTSDERYRAV